MRSRYFLAILLLSSIALLSWNEYIVFVVGTETENWNWYDAELNRVLPEDKHHRETRKSFLQALAKDRRMHRTSCNPTVPRYQLLRQHQLSFIDVRDGLRVRERRSSTPVELTAPWRGLSVALTTLKQQRYWATDEDYTLFIPKEDRALFVRDNGMYSTPSESNTTANIEDQATGLPLPFFNREEQVHENGVFFDQRWGRLLQLDSLAWKMIFSEYKEVYAEYLVIVFSEWSFRAGEAANALSSIADHLDLFVTDTSLFEFSSATPLPLPIVAPKMGAFSHFWDCYTGLSLRGSEKYSEQKLSSAILPPAKLLHGISPSPGLRPYSNVLQLVMAVPYHNMPNGTLPKDVDPQRSSSIYWVTSTPQVVPPSTLRLSKLSIRQDPIVNPNIIKWIPFEETSAVRSKDKQKDESPGKLTALERFLLRHTRSSLFLFKENILWDRLLVDYDVVALLVPPPTIVCPAMSLLQAERTFHRMSSSLQQWSDSLYAYTQAIRNVVPFFVFVGSAENSTHVSAPCRLPSWHSSTSTPHIQQNTTTIFGIVEDVEQPVDLKELFTISLKSKSKIHLSNMGSENDWTLTVLSQLKDPSGETRVVKRDLLVPGLGTGPANAELFSSVGTVLVDVLQDVLAAWPVREVTGRNFEETVRRTFYPISSSSTHRKKSASRLVREIIVVTQRNTSETMGKTDSCEMFARREAMMDHRAGKNKERRYFFVPERSTQLLSELEYGSENEVPNDGLNAINPPCSQSSCPLEIPLHCNVYCITRDERLFHFSRQPVIDPNTESAEERTVFSLAHPPPEAIHQGLQEIKSILDLKNKKRTTSVVKNDDVLELLSARRQAAGDVSWWVWIPEGKSVPVLLYSHSPTGNRLAAPHFVLVYDSSCGLSSNYLKSMRILEQCYSAGTNDVLNGGATFLYFDVSAVQRASSWTSGIDDWKRRSGPLEPILFPYYLGEISKIQSPQLLLFNATHAVSTMSTVAYIDNDHWLASLIDWFRTVDKRTDKEDSRENADKKIWACIEELVATENRTRQPFRESWARRRNH